MEAVKAMAVVAPYFGLVPLKEMACPKAKMALIPHVTLIPLSIFLSLCRYWAEYGPDCKYHIYLFHCRYYTFNESSFESTLILY